MSRFWFSRSILVLPLLGAIPYQHPPSQVLNVTTGAPVPFASIGIKNKPLGTVADAQGRFAPSTLAAAEATDTLVVSCVGYQPRKLLAADLPHLPEIRLTPQPHQLAEVKVRATSWKRHRVGHDGSFSLTHYNFHLNGDTDLAHKLGREVGAVLHIQPGSELEEVHFYIGQNTFRQVRLRINLRALDAEGEPAASLLTQDIHYALPDDATGWQHLDLRPYHIQTGPQSRVAVTLEWLTGTPDPAQTWQRLLMPAPLGPLHRMVYRDKSADRWRNLRASLALYVTALSPRS